MNGHVAAVGEANASAEPQTAEFHVGRVFHLDSVEPHVAFAVGANPRYGVRRADTPAEDDVGFVDSGIQVKGMAGRQAVDNCLQWIGWSGIVDVILEREGAAGAAGEGRVEVGRVGARAEVMPGGVGKALFSDRFRHELDIVFVGDGVADDDFGAGVVPVGAHGWDGSCGTGDTMGHVACEYVFELRVEPRLTIIAEARVVKGFVVIEGVAFDLQANVAVVDQIAPHDAAV